MPDKVPSGLFSLRIWPRRAHWLLLPPAAVAAGFLFADNEPGFRTLDGVSIIRTSLHKINRAFKADKPEVVVTLKVHPRPVLVPADGPGHVAGAVLPQPRPASPPSPPRIDPVPAGPLAGFYRGLKEVDAGARTRPVTILHLGDSHIASDRFSGDLRALFQTRFGNAGRGMMMPGFPFPYYHAQGVKFAKQGAWTASNSFRNDSGPYGVTGVRLTTRQAGAWISLTSVDGPFEWAEATFLTGPGMGGARLSVDSVSESASMDSKQEGLRRLRIEHKGTELAVTSRGEGPISVLSWAVGY
ncbi:MAG: hypothetical protein AB7U38_09305, partial [Hyphomicrobiales bacterium]